MDLVWSLFTYDWIPVNGTPSCGIRLPDTHGYFCKLTIGQRDPRVLGCHTMMEEGTSAVQYALKMYEYIERLHQLGYWMKFELSIELILMSLPNSFA